jgi:multiple sugar transport system permease protein
VAMTGQRPIAETLAPSRRAVVAKSRRRGWRQVWERDTLLGYSLIAPAMLILLVFVAYPFVYGIWLALSDTFVGRPGSFVGLRNFVDLYRDDIFRRTVLNTFEYTIVACTFKFVFGLGMAVALNQEYPGKRFVRAAVLLPWIIPTVLSTLAWLWMFDSTFSVFNWVLDRVGIQGPMWLGEGHWPMISIIIVNIWRGTPFFGVCFLAGMQTISEELYDAARVDGANAWQKFWHITFPLLMPVTTVVTLLSVILTFADFQLIYVLTRGGPANSTQVFGTLAYWMGIYAGRLGIGAAISLTMFPVLAIVMYLTLRALRKEGV